MEWNRYQRKIVKAPEEETLDERQVRACPGYWRQDRRAEGVSAVSSPEGSSKGFPLLSAVRIASHDTL